MVEINNLGLKNLPSKLLSGNGEVDTSTALDNDAIGFYFSAHWCPPCRGFTPLLADAYKDWKKDGKKIEIIFVTSDKDEDSFAAYFKEMPWLAIPKSNVDAISELKAKFKVSGIPKLVILDKSGKIIDDNARSTVTSNPSGAIDLFIKF